jgi:predicted AlkP superfamily pyrophosphatase or phosphodiesterase
MIPYHGSFHRKDDPMARRLSLALLAAVSLAAGTIRAADPRLIVVISIDQFPYEYLERFKAHFGRDGFNRLLDGGASFVAASYEHAMTVTGAGHAVILSGAYADQQGIVGNEWYDRSQHHEVYCVSDETCQLIGASGPGSSPRNFTCFTFGDELRIASAFRSKVISISHKDRSAILMGGKLATAAFWMKDSAFISSTYYFRELPDWARAFNNSGTVNSYFGKTWNRLLPDSAYASMDRDDAPYEDGSRGLGIVFPHPIHGGNPAKITKDYYRALLKSPFGNEVLLSFAKRALRGEMLGQRGVTDLLCISFSSNDFVGHAYGPHSHEVLDMTVRTDRVIADLLAFLDQEIGLQHCIVALTSDHAVGPIPAYLRAGVPSLESRQVAAGALRTLCDSAVTASFGKPPAGKPWIEAITGRNIYVNYDALRAAGIARDAAARAIVDALRNTPFVAGAYSSQEIESLSPATILEKRLKNSFHPARSGDVVYVLEPYVSEGDEVRGASHGDPYEYAAHVPLVILGEGIQKGRYAASSSPADLAPTLSVLTGVEFPPCREGRVLLEALKSH